MSHFRPQIPVFIGGRQPYAPRLGIAQSGPPFQPCNAVAVATLSVIVGAWQPPFQAVQGSARIAPLLPAAAVPSQPPVQTSVNLAITLAAWAPPVLPSQGYGELAPLIPAAAAPSQPPILSRINAALVVDSWRSPFFYPQGYGELAPLIGIAPDAPPIRSGNLPAGVLSAWSTIQQTAIPLASFAAQIPVDSPPGRTIVNLSLIRSAWEPPYFGAQGYSDIANLIPAPVVPDQPPVPGRGNLFSLVSSWQPPNFFAQGFGDIAPNIPTGAAPSAPPLPGRQAIALAIASWNLPILPAQGYGDIAPVIPAANTLPASSSPQTFRVIIDSWSLQRPNLQVRPSVANFPIVVVYVPISGQTVTVYGPNDTKVNG